MLVYRRSDNLNLIIYSDSDFVECSDDFKLTSRYISILARGAVS